MDWLLSGPAWIQYRARVDLLHEAEDQADPIRLKKQAIEDPAVTKLVFELAEWPGKVLSSHKSASQPYHRLNFLADLGLRAADPGVQAVLERVMAHVSEQGPFQLPMNISAGHGGSGTDTWAWALCDAPLLLYPLVKMGLGDHPQVQKALDFLLGLVRGNGWPCAVSPELGNFRGPGRKDDPCPYANLAMLKLIGQVEDLREIPEAQIGINTLLTLWEQRSEQHPYIFYMGTDFCKLKAPLVWYDILHVLDVLSCFPAWRDDPRLTDMIGIVLEKADAEGRFTAESIWTPWKEWEFGQKKVPSRWITLLVYRVMDRLA